jgi:opacity protein-like surface antigen
MQKLFFLSITLVFLLAHPNLYSFDGERNGFILGGGIGVGFLSNTTSFESFSNTDERGVFLTNFKIGYAPSNVLELFYINKVSWWGQSDITFTLGVSAIAARYYFDQETETGWSVTGGFGLSALSAPFEENLESSSGFGLFAGGGYEFSNHWTVEFDLLYSAVSEGDVDFNSFGIQITINGLAY